MILPTGKVLGGGSTINLMNYERGDLKDYDRWEQEFGATGWNGQSMFEYFMKDENNLDYSISGEQRHTCYHVRATAEVAH